MKVYTILITAVLMGGASAGPNAAAATTASTAVKFPAHFKCLNGQTGTSVEGILPETPKTYPMLGEESKTTFFLNGQSGEVKYGYNSNCFISRAGEKICFAPNEIGFDMAASVVLPNGKSATKLNGTLTIYEDSTYLHIQEIEPELVEWYENLTCQWIK